MEVHQNIWDRTALWPSNPTSEYLSEVSKNLIQKDIGIPKFTAALLNNTIAKIWKQPKKDKKVIQSCLTLCDPMNYTVHEILQARILEWVAFPFSRGPSQLRDRTCLPHCRRILYQLSHKGSPRILEWVAYPFSSGSSQPRNRTRVSCIAGRQYGGNMLL